MDISARFASKAGLYRLICCGMVVSSPSYADSTRNAVPRVCHRIICSDRFAQLRHVVKIENIAQIHRFHRRRQISGKVGGQSQFLRQRRQQQTRQRNIAELAIKVVQRAL